MKRLTFILMATLWGIVTHAQTIFPTQFIAPAEFNTGTVRISVIIRGTITPMPLKY